MAVGFTVPSLSNSRYLISRREQCGLPNDAQGKAERAALRQSWSSETRILTLIKESKGYDATTR